jgi:hypothetical protein
MDERRERKWNASWRYKVWREGGIERRGMEERIGRVKQGEGKDIFNIFPQS